MKTQAVLALSLLLLSTSVLESVRTAHASDCIPVFGQKWAKSYIGVYIAGGVGDVQRQQVLLALDIWYSVQQWFIDSFEGGVGTPYLFYLTDQPGDSTITVSFFIGQNVGFAGRALNFVYVTPGNTFVRGEIQINLPPDHASNPTDLEVESVILHELGHGLGLGHSDIPQDAMYAIDNYPQNYGLPSTLDLYAVYRLKQTADPASLGGTVCLPSSIGYGLPPWVRQYSDRYEIVYPAGKFTGGYSYSIAYSPSVDLGGVATFNLRVKCEGDYPLKVVYATATTDYGENAPPTLLLPLIVEPGGEKTLSYTISIPDSVSLGQHSISFRLGTSILSARGWSSEVKYDTFDSSFMVTQPIPATTYVLPTQTTEAQVTQEMGGSYVASIAPLLAIVVFLLVPVLLIVAHRNVSQHKYGPTKGTQSDLSTKIYCTRCGTALPVDSKFCNKCGEATS